MSFFPSVLSHLTLNAINSGGNIIPSAMPLVIIPLYLQPFPVPVSPLFISFLLVLGTLLLSVLIFLSDPPFCLFSPYLFLFFAHNSRSAQFFIIFIPCLSTVCWVLNIFVTTFAFLTHFCIFCHKFLPYKN